MVVLVVVPALLLVLVVPVPRYLSQVGPTNVVLPGRTCLDLVPGIIGLSQALRIENRVVRMIERSYGTLVPGTNPTDMRMARIDRANDHTVLILVPIGGSNSSNSTHSQNHVTF